MNLTPHPTIEQWVADLHRRGKSQTTVNTYRRGLLHFGRWSEQTYGQPFDPAAIIPRDVADWKAHQQTVGKAAPNTINVRLGAVSRFFAWAVKQGLTRDNPAAEISGLRLPPRQPKSLDKVYVRRLLRHISKGGQLRDLAIAEMLLGTGLRVSELLALQTGDVTLNDRRGQVVIRRGKGAVHRAVPLTTAVRRALQAYFDSPLFQVWQADNPEIKDNLPLWAGERGPLQDRSGIFLMLRKYARRAGLDPDQLSPHVLRHTFATRYLAANPGDFRGLADLLGHASINTVMIYTVPSADDLADRMETAEHHF